VEPFPPGIDIKGKTMNTQTELQKALQNPIVIVDEDERLQIERVDESNYFANGPWYITPGIKDRADSDKAFKRFIAKSIWMHGLFHYGELGTDDEMANYHAVQTKSGMVLSRYTYTDNTTMFVLTYYRDKKPETTVMFSSEY
jgi:hypothetical protein